MAFFCFVVVAWIDDYDAAISATDATVFRGYIRRQKIFVAFSLPTGPFIPSIVCL